MTKTYRDSKFELIRIVAIILIMAQHVVERGMGGEWRIFSNPLSLNLVVTMFLGSWGQLGVLLFVIVSSWFMVDRQGIHSRKIVNLIFQTWSSCLLIVAFFIFFKPEYINLKLIVKELLTPVNKQYWFITTFIVFYLIVPLLQKNIQGLSDRALRNVCIVLTFVIPVYNLISTNVGDSLADFCYIFYLVSYLKRHEDNFFEKNSKLGIIGLVLLTIVFVLIKILLPESFMGKDSSTIFMKIYLVLRGRTPIMIMISLFIFYSFKNCKINYHKPINAISGTMLGVYIIHENYLFRGVENGSSAFLWDGIFHMDWWYNNSSFCGFAHIGIVLLVFTCCVILELIRKNTIEKVFNNKREKIDGYCNEFDSFYSKQIFCQKK